MVGYLPFGVALGRANKRGDSLRQLLGEEDICLCFASHSVLGPGLEKSMWGWGAVVRRRQPVVLRLLSPGSHPFL